ncbi:MULTISPECIES: transporter substrate-binding domain-containing protein [Inquilinus]|uniref:Polar amino acid transport system substrate-binding protein n=1 Tax=Inquilinus ginsengisoli TaxID=363840 RepID=A0ABU1JLJ6_9PROT|nr:transporter substrate-binding domain-containing protein [Inquilinus ginsengisoli]MDR6289491.1 polar amino acid transport system substrate-binding protein [Inquilinus ginsengisoli]
MRLRSIVLAAAAIGLLSSGPAFAGAVLDRITQAKKLVMSTDPEYPPQSSLNASNQFEGFDIDVGTEIAKRLGVSIEFVTPGWETIVSGKWAGRWDVSVGSMTPTKPRAEVLDFPAIYYYTPAALAVNTANTTIKTPADASGKRIGVGAATTYENYLHGDLAIEAEGAPPFEFVIKDAKIQSYDTDVPALDDLKLGDGTRLDAAMTALPTIQAAIKNGYPLRVVGAPLYYEPLAVAIEKGDPELKAKLAEIVKAMQDDGTLTSLSMKWYGVDLTKPAS